MVTTPTTKRQARILELDFLKCVFILLMIVFHLVYIGNRYPVAKAFVYTFHMPGFLIISGYLLHVHKPVPQFLRYIQWIFVPYLLMESGYVVMASVLPIREHIQQLTFGLFLDKLFLHPLGPYWYLHTLMLCGIVTYIVAQFVSHHRVWMLLCVLLCLWVLALLGLVTWINAVYFCIGVALRLYHRPFVDTFHPAWWSFIGIVLVATCEPNALQRHTIGGMLIVYFVISFLLWLYPYLPKGMAKIALFIGRNSLILLLFSPMFTVLSKLFQSYLLFEPSGMLFMLVALLFTVVGSFTVAYILQKLHVARYVFGKSRIIK
ncbi:acyltransferase family protein [Hoylesella timonensis]|uniref:acyltransferase family protein n=1 Tax=Hoylesella timonensis TaxID=386414 RepID=UPI00242B7242|nr:acyltransferase family protein [Hoylesella timonensis]